MKCVAVHQDDTDWDTQSNCNRRHAVNVSSGLLDFQVIVSQAGDRQARSEVQSFFVKITDQHCVGPTNGASINLAPRKKQPLIESEGHSADTVLQN